MKIKINIHRNLCQSIATCVAVAPSIYVLDDEFKAKLKSDSQPTKQDDIDSYIVELTKSELQKYIDGAETCPYKAIEIINEETGKKIYPGR